MPTRLEQLQELNRQQQPAGSKLEALRRLNAEKSVPDITLESTGQKVGGDTPPGEPVKLSLGESAEMAFRSLLPDAANKFLEEESPARLGLEMVAGAVAPETLPLRLAGPASGLATRFGSKALAGGTAGGLSSLAAETFDPSEEPLKRAATTAGFGAGGELAASGIGALGGAIAKRINKATAGGFVELIPGAKEAFEQIGDRATLTPGQLTDNPIVDTLQNVAEGSFTGGSAFKAARETAEAVATVDVDAFVQKFLNGRGTEAVGGSLQDAIQAASDAKHAIGSEMYGWVDEYIDLMQQSGKLSKDLSTPLSGVSLKAVRAAAAGIVETSSIGPKNSQLRTAAQGVMDTIDQYPDGRVPWQIAHTMRSRLLGVTRSSTELVGGETMGAAKHMSKMVNSSMERAAQDVGPEFRNVWRGVNGFWKELNETFNDKFIRSLMQAEPEVVLNRVARKDMPGTIRKVRRAIMDPALKGQELAKAQELWKEVQGHTLLKMANQAQDAGLQQQGQRSLRLLDKFGDDTIKELFLDPGDISTYKKALRTLEITQQEIGKDLPGKMFIQLGQASALVGVLSGALNSKALSFTLAPAAVGKMFTNKNFIKWLTIGTEASKVGNKTKTLQAYTRLQAIVAAETKNLERERTKEK